MTWSDSLIKLATYEVEILQKRLAEVRGRREAAETKLAVLHAEGEAEGRRRDGEDPLAGLYRTAFLDALRARKAEAEAEIAQIALEEEGAREALARAFEEQKKYEQLAEQARTLESKERLRRETAAYDELGLRKKAK